MGTVVCAHTSYVDPPVPGPYFECTYDYHMYPNALVVMLYTLYQMGHLHTGKCIRRFADIYAYCRYFIGHKW